VRADRRAARQAARLIRGCDNGPEFISQAVLDWCRFAGPATGYTQHRYLIAIGANDGVMSAGRGRLPCGCVSNGLLMTLDVVPVAMTTRTWPSQATPSSAQLQARSPDRARPRHGRPPEREHFVSAITTQPASLV
jgi:hypothetical protein